MCTPNANNYQQLKDLEDSGKPMARFKTTDLLKHEKEIIRRRYWSVVKGDYTYVSCSQHVLDVHTMLTTPVAHHFLKSKQEMQRLLGRLYGYSEDQIDEFMEANIVCDCIDCNGAFK